MKQKAKNIFKAFITGFIMTALTIFVLSAAVPAIGLKFNIGWKPTFELDKTAGLIYASWFAPLLMGVIFAIVQFFDDFNPHIKGYSHKLVTNSDIRELIVIFWHGFWGLMLGFALTMLLMAITSGTNATYHIPYLIEITAKNGEVNGRTSIITIFTILGLLWGLWKTEHLPKIRKNNPHSRTKK